MVWSRMLWSYLILKWCRHPGAITRQYRRRTREAGGGNSCQNDEDIRTALWRIISFWRSFRMDDKLQLFLFLFIIRMIVNSLECLLHPKHYSSIILYLYYFILTATKWGTGTLNIPIWQMRNLRHREVNSPKDIQHKGNKSSDIHGFIE